MALLPGRPGKISGKVSGFNQAILGQKPGDFLTKGWFHSSTLRISRFPATCLLELRGQVSRVPRSGSKEETMYYDKAHLARDSEVGFKALAQ